MKKGQGTTMINRRYAERYSDTLSARWWDDRTRRDREYGVTSMRVNASTTCPRCQGDPSPYGHDCPVCGGWGTIDPP